MCLGHYQMRRIKRSESCNLIMCHERNWKSLIQSKSVELLAVWDWNSACYLALKLFPFYLIIFSFLNPFSWLFELFGFFDLRLLRIWCIGLFARLITIRRGGRVRLNAPVLKTGRPQGLVGSNPTPSAIIFRQN